MNGYRNMNNFDIAIAFVSFGKNDNSEKKRPVLIVKFSEDEFYFYAITSKFATKSYKIQLQYFEIKDWESSGLLVPSWIDILSAQKISTDDFIVKKIGILSKFDRIRLKHFLSSYYQDRR